MSENSKKHDEGKRAAYSQDGELTFSQCLISNHNSEWSRGFEEGKPEVEKAKMEERIKRNS